MSTSVDDISIGVFDDGEGYRFYEYFDSVSYFSIYLFSMPKGIVWLYVSISVDKVIIDQVVLEVSSSLTIEIIIRYGHRLGGSN